MVNDLLNYLDFLPVILTAPCGLLICLCSCYQNSKDLFLPFITQGKTYSFWRHVIAELKPFIVFYFPSSHVEMACGVIQVVLKKVAIVIRRTSKGNKLEILVISFLVKIWLNGMINAQVLPIEVLPPEEGVINCRDKLRPLS